MTWQVGFAGLITSNEKEVDFLNSTKSSSMWVAIPRLHYCYENVYSVCADSASRHGI